MEFFRKADGYESKLLVDAALAQPSPAPELAERGTQHRFSTAEQTCRHDFAGVWWNDNGETKTGRECRHCGFFVADVIKAQAEKAEAERQEVVDFNPYRYHAEKIRQRADGAASAYEAGRSALGYMEDIAESALIVRNGLDELSAQHERITAKLHDALDESDGDRWKMRSERDAANARLHEVATACATAEQERDGLWRDLRDARAHIDTQAAVTAQLKGERDAALARVAELEKLQQVDEHVIEHLSLQMDIAESNASSRRAKAQHSVPDGYRLIRLEHFAAIKAQLNPEQVDAYRGRNIYDEDKVYANWNACRSALDEIKDAFQQIDWDAENELAELLAAAPGKEVPQAWLDVQAERRRQVEVEGYHGFRDSHYINYELSKAARAYIEVSWHALSGGLPCKKPESWPWMAGFKWADGRTMLVKAGALILAEIERLDRAAAPGKEGV